MLAVVARWARGGGWCAGKCQWRRLPTCLPLRTQDPAGRFRYRHSHVKMAHELLGMGNPLLDISAHVGTDLFEKCVHR